MDSLAAVRLHRHRPGRRGPAAAGAEIVQPPQETAFGTGVPARAFTASDPEGNLWTFGTYRGVE